MPFNSAPDRIFMEAMVARGYAAVAGWDPVTGLGTPNYEKLAAVVKALP